MKNQRDFITAAAAKTILIAEHPEDWIFLNLSDYDICVIEKAFRVAEEKMAESFKGHCCQPEDMRPYRGQKGSVSKATHFCRACGQHWIFAKAAKPGEQEWFSATPATPALEEKDGS